jgi:hypothetical protein
MDARPNNPQFEPDRPAVPKNEARQGVTGHNVRLVLGIGLGSVILLFLLVYLAFFGR